MSEIAALANSALTTFKALIASLDPSLAEAASASSHLARLKLWVGSLGAHRSSGYRSLEYRLRDASSIRDHITSLLRDVCQLIREAKSSLQGGSSQVLDKGEGDDLDDELARLLLEDEDGSSESELSQLLEDIGGVVDCLLRLSVTISNPAPHDQFKSRAGVEAIAHYEPWDIQHVRNKFTDLEPRVTERLGISLTRRRKYFKYREEHNTRLREGLEIEHETPVVVEVVGCERTTVASSLPQHLKDAESAAVPKVDAEEPVAFDFCDDQSEASGTSYAPSAANPGELRVPRIPEEYINGPFMCPFCYTMVSIDSRHAWKKHVFRDLRPYVCLDPDCTMPHEQYARRKQWARHMREEHWKTWTCSLGCSTEFDSAEKFQTHVQATHADDIATDNIRTLSNLSSHLDLSKAEGNCPLCPEFELKNSHQHESHVGNHLEQLALFALPNVLEQEDDDENDDDTEDEAFNSEANSDVDSLPAEPEVPPVLGVAGKVELTFEPFGSIPVIMRQIGGRWVSPAVQSAIFPHHLSIINDSRDSSGPQFWLTKPPDRIVIFSLEPSLSTSLPVVDDIIAALNQQSGLLNFYSEHFDNSYLMPLIPGVNDLLPILAPVQHPLLYASQNHDRPLLLAVFVCKEGVLDGIRIERLSADGLDRESLLRWLKSHFGTDFDFKLKNEGGFHVFQVPEQLASNEIAELNKLRVEGAEEKSHKSERHGDGDNSDNNSYNMDPLDGLEPDEKRTPDDVVSQASDMKDMNNVSDDASDGSIDSQTGIPSPNRHHMQAMRMAGLESLLHQLTAKNRMLNGTYKAPVRFGSGPVPSKNIGRWQKIRTMELESELEQVIAENRELVEAPGQVESTTGINSTAFPEQGAEMESKKSAETDGFSRAPTNWNLSQLQNDEAGEEKITPSGELKGGRKFRCRTFHLPHGGDRHFMLASECAQQLGYSNTFELLTLLPFLDRSADLWDKEHLISEGIITVSDITREINVVLAREMFQRFGSKIIVDGRGSKDDYYETEAHKEGLTEYNLPEDDALADSKPSDDGASEHEAESIPLDTKAASDPIDPTPPINKCRMMLGSWGHKVDTLKHEVRLLETSRQAAGNAQRVAETKNRLDLAQHQKMGWQLRLKLAEEKEKLPKALIEETRHEIERIEKSIEILVAEHERGTATVQLRAAAGGQIPLGLGSGAGSRDDTINTSDPASTSHTIRETTPDSEKHTVTNAWTCHNCGDIWSRMISVCLREECGHAKCDDCSFHVRDDAVVLEPQPHQAERDLQMSRTESHPTDTESDSDNDSIRSRRVRDVTTEAIAIFVEIIRTLPETSAVATERPLQLERVAETAATSKHDSALVRRGIRAMEILSDLSEGAATAVSEGGLESHPLRARSRLLIRVQNVVDRALLRLASLQDKVIREETEKHRSNNSTLLVSGFNPSISSAELGSHFGKYGHVNYCHILKDPLGGYPLKFAVVEMKTPEMADAAQENLQGLVLRGRVLNIFRGVYNPHSDSGGQPSQQESAANDHLSMTSGNSDSESEHNHIRPDPPYRSKFSKRGEPEDEPKDVEIAGPNDFHDMRMPGIMTPYPYFNNGPESEPFASGNDDMPPDPAHQTTPSSKLVELELDDEPSSDVKSTTASDHADGRGVDNGAGASSGGFPPGFDPSIYPTLAEAFLEAEQLQTSRTPQRASNLTSSFNLPKEKKVREEEQWHQVALPGRSTTTAALPVAAPSEEGGEHLPSSSAAAAAAPGGSSSHDVNSHRPIRYREGGQISTRFLVGPLPGEDDDWKLRYFQIISPDILEYKRVDFLPPTTNGGPMEFVIDFDGWLGAIPLEEGTRVDRVAVRHSKQFDFDSGKFRSEPEGGSTEEDTYIYSAIRIRGPATTEADEEEEDDDSGHTRILVAADRKARDWWVATLQQLVSSMSDSQDGDRIGEA
ncbi:hypothetical protein B0H63DRAFT_468525 [Podospora didyma]|uniref:RRM domain-containing protein n=1 Tax=Podospora didyma TaxID=330526 RepID=A0AAE0U189_9PEZI|nr:hypothetical protein B0H63DRAFT_468525 [Podospora didyma]